MPSLVFEHIQIHVFLSGRRSESDKFGGGGK